MKRKRAHVLFVTLCIVAVSSAATPYIKLEVFLNIISGAIECITEGHYSRGIYAHSKPRAHLFFYCSLYLLLF